MPILLVFYELGKTWIYSPERPLFELLSERPWVRIPPGARFLNLIFAQNIKIIERLPPDDFFRLLLINPENISSAANTFGFLLILPCVFPTARY